MLGTDDRPLRIAVIGSGPSGFYAAEALLSAETQVAVDLYDSLPTPFGLVRYGVAPDHPKIKRVIKVYERTARRPGFSFLGNVHVGRDIAIDELRAHYDAVILASGAQTDRHLGVPGEELAGSYAATEFVGWYNGHPDYVDRSFDLSHEVAVVIGQGNVAVDVARILCKTADELCHTDITAPALEALAESRIREVHMIGRRGPTQAAFSPQEIKEFVDLEDCEPMMDPVELNLNAASQKEFEKKNHVRNNMRVLKEFSARSGSGRSRRFVVHFRRSPVEIIGDGHVRRVRLEKNKLEGDSGSQRAVGTGETFEIDCGIFFRSVGYLGVPMPGLPFDERSGTIPNIAGRVTEGGVVIPGLYAVGWIKRGPSGVIGTNKPDAIETVKNLLADVPRLEPCATPWSEAVMDLLTERGVKVVGYDDWRRIDAAEVARGKPVGKPREKFLRVEEMVAAAQ